MSANNKTGKIHKTSEWIRLLRLLLIILITFSAVLLISCHKGETPKYSVIVLDEKNNANITNENIVVNIPETNNTSNISVIHTIISNKTEEQETILNKTITETKQEQEQIPARANEVDFYFLLKGKSYFRYTLKEHELKAFNMSGTIIRIVPIFIANDSVIFKVDEYTTQAVGYKEWFTMPGFEIYVNDIYYRR
jgi:hypothetical protein